MREPTILDTIVDLEKRGEYVREYIQEKLGYLCEEKVGAYKVQGNVLDKIRRWHSVRMSKAKKGFEGAKKDKFRFEDDGFGSRAVADGQRTKGERFKNFASGVGHSAAAAAPSAALLGGSGAGLYYGMKDDNKSRKR